MLKKYHELIMDAIYYVGNGNQSPPEGDSQKESNASESDKSRDNGSQKSNGKPLDWREFRASLYIQEQVHLSFYHYLLLILPKSFERWNKLSWS